MDMETHGVNSETCRRMIAIIEERDRYRDHLATAKMTILKLENRNAEYERMLVNAHAALAQNIEPVIAVESVYFIGHWVASPASYPLLAPIEELWQKGNLQQALCQIPALLHRSDLDEHHRVNIRLLYAALLQQTQDNLPKALLVAEEGLSIAFKSSLHELAGKAQYWRGVCFLMLDEYAKADWCFILASHVAHHGPFIQECREKIRRALEQLSSDDSRQAVSEEFLLQGRVLES